LFDVDEGRGLRGVDCLKQVSIRSLQINIQESEADHDSDYLPEQTTAITQTTREIQRIE
jgi:hypothetical protein